MTISPKYLLSFWVMLFSVATVYADIDWIGKNYNYGTIREVDGPQKGQVRFINKGSEPTFINNVRPGCGCTEVDYTQGMIQPGDTATVSFFYNPIGRPGAFDKTVRVYIGKENEMHLIKLYGTVIGSPATLEYGYPKVVGALRLETLTVKTGELKKGAARHLFINAYNQSADTITPTWDFNERGLAIELTPRSIPPGDVATFGFYLKTSEEERMGPIDYKISLRANDKESDNDSCEITVSTIIVPDTQNMSVEEVEQGPRAYLLPEFIDFGENLDDGIIRFSFDILNDGKSDLKVLRVYSQESCVRVKDVPQKIKAGKKGKVKGELDIMKVKNGPFRIPVEIMTNDQLHPLRTANLVGIKE